MSRYPSFDEYATVAWPRLIRAAVLAGVDAHTAEDIVQSALTKCYVSWKRVQRAENPDAYVHRVIFRTIIDHRRRRSSHEIVTRLPDDSHDVADPTDAILGSTIVRNALEALPAKQREVLVLRYFLDLSEAETATALDIPVGTVKSRNSRGLEALSKHPDAFFAREEGEMNRE